MFEATLTVLIAKEDHLTPFIMLSSAKHEYSDLAPPTPPSTSTISTMFSLVELVEACSGPLPCNLVEVNGTLLYHLSQSWWMLKEITKKLAFTENIPIPYMVYDHISAPPELAPRGAYSGTNTSYFRS